MSKPDSQDRPSASAMRDNSKDTDELQEQPAPSDASAASTSLLPSAALTAQATQWRAFGPAQRLFTDGVASCLGFLSLADFNSAARTCKGWRAGARAVKSLDQSNLTASVTVLPVLIASPLRHIVKSFTDADLFPDGGPWSTEREHPSCGPAQLAGLHALSDLTRVQLRLDLDQFDDATPIQYPPRLTTVRLELGCAVRLEDDDAWDAAPILHGLASCASLTRLKLELDEDPITLTSLGSLQQLQHLTIDGYVLLHYTPATLHAIKSLPLLRTLTLGHSEDEDFIEYADPFDTEWLTPLLTTPHRLQQLRSLEVGPGMFNLWDNEFGTQLLPSLPALTELKPHIVSVLALPVLAAFPKLRSLHLSFDSFKDSTRHPGNEGVAAAFDRGCARLSLLVPHLTHCSLTELSLDGVASDHESMAALCHSQPLLRALHLQCASLTTLQPLSTLTRLTQLTVEFASHADPLPELFDQLCACKSLQQLTLIDIAPALSEAQQQQLTPPSTVLPRLTKLRYRA